jgi:hypothetical protein
MKQRLLLSLLALPLALASAYSHAADGDSPTVSISGFGTGALTWADSDDAHFARANQAKGVGTKPRTGPDSNLGLQATVTMNSWLSATAQGLVRKDAEDDFGAELAWAFVKAKVSDNLSFRVGRMGLPVFMVSDFRNVGYANTMVRPPIEVYGQIPSTYIDGVDAAYQYDLGATKLGTKLTYGVNRTQSTDGVYMKGKKMYSVEFTAERGPVTGWFGYNSGRLTMYNDGLTGAFNGMRGAAIAYGEPALATLADTLDWNDKKVSFTAVGLTLDWHNIVGQTEVARSRTAGFAGGSKSWYVMGGYRIGKFLPYYNHSKAERVDFTSNTIPTSCSASAAAGCAATMQGLSAFVDGLNVGSNQTTDSVGVRWDFSHSAALKVQVDRIVPGKGNGFLLDVKPGFSAPLVVTAVAVDFVF